MQEFLEGLWTRWTGGRAEPRSVIDASDESRDEAAIALGGGTYPVELHDSPFWESVDPVPECKLGQQACLASGDLNSKAQPVPVLVWSEGRRLGNIPTGRGVRA